MKGEILVVEDEASWRSRVRDSIPCNQMIEARRRHRVLGLIWVVALLASACADEARKSSSTSTPSPTPSVVSSPPAPPPPPPPPEFVVDKAMPHIRELSMVIGKRPAGSEAEAKAVVYLEQVFSSFGYQTERRGFPNYVGSTSFNVIARLAGVDYSQGYLLVGGHYDTVVGSPGANDNASGIGVVLAMAEAFSGRGVPVEFVGFGAEEYPPSRAGHHAGSDSYVGALAEPRLVKGMVSVDMIGAGPKVQIVRYPSGPEDLQKEMAVVADSIGIPHLLRTMGHTSDHVGFARKRIPATFLYSGHHPTWHQPNDIFPVVQREAVDRTGRLTIEWLRRRLL